MDLTWVSLSWVNKYKQVRNLKRR